MVDWKPGASIEVLRQRACLIRTIRRFFYDRDVLEVETPALSQYPAIDLHLESFSLPLNHRFKYLITSPEYHMKRLLAAGSGSVFQVSKAFRMDEAGSRHNPEFTILEWYREGWNHWRLMEEIDLLLQKILGCEPADYITYANAFQTTLQVDPFRLTSDHFKTICRQKQAVPPADLLQKSAQRDDRLNYLMGAFIEPELGKERPVFLHDYPASQANLAKLYDQNPDVAMRFEVYFKGLELGNGFCELTDAGVQEKRFREENRSRLAAGKSELPIDVNFLAALQAGMPECSGVAMGVDRLVMLALGIETVDRAMAFSWSRA